MVEDVSLSVYNFFVSDKYVLGSRLPGAGPGHAASDASRDIMGGRRR